jgi:hypothetical protein
MLFIHSYQNNFKTFSKSEVFKLAFAVFWWSAKRSQEIWVMNRSQKWRQIQTGKLIRNFTTFDYSNTIIFIWKYELLNIFLTCLEFNEMFESSKFKIIKLSEYIFRNHNKFLVGIQSKCWEVDLLMSGRRLAYRSKWLTKRKSLKTTAQNNRVRLVCGQICSIFIVCFQ